MGNDIDFIVQAAETHPAEYLLHKYWSRKPHNVVSRFLKWLLPAGGVVVDPFCGSGVVLREAADLGVEAHGFDVNPIAILLSRVTADPPKAVEFSKAVGSILDELQAKAAAAYSIGSETVRYVVHETVVKCRECKAEVAPAQALRDGRIYRCKVCHKRLSFNLENLVETRVVGVALHSRRELAVDESMLLDQATRAARLFGRGNVTEYDAEFDENRRILAFKGLTTSRLFTKRNFSLLASVADEIHRIKNERSRNAALLMLTGSVVQASRLIPFRNNLGTGGPAWTVPGFWVPPVHIEANPFIHLKARYAKFLRGIESLQKRSSLSPIKVTNIDAREGLSKFSNSGRKADLIFLDPPYGDSIPFVEFSAIWNSFLKQKPPSGVDISVSDRELKVNSWCNYRKSLAETASAAKGALNRNGKLLVTFNNNDERAWEAILNALQSNHFRSNYVGYQIPAVVSSKAQFAPLSSYVSDIYAVLSISSEKPNRSLEPAVLALRRCASSREGRVPSNVAQRTLMVAWLKNNIAVELLPKRLEILSSMFEVEGNTLIFRHDLLKGVPLIKETLRDVMNDSAACEGGWSSIYQKIALVTADYGVPDPSEIETILSDTRIFSKKAVTEIRASQLALF